MSCDVLGLDQDSNICQSINLGPCVTDSQKFLKAKSEIVFLNSMIYLLMGSCF